MSNFFESCSSAYLWKDNLWVLLATVLFPKWVYSSWKEVLVIESCSQQYSHWSPFANFLPVVTTLILATEIIAVVSSSTNLTSACVSTKENSLLEVSF